MLKKIFLTLLVAVGLATEGWSQAIFSWQISRNDSIQPKTVQFAKKDSAALCMDIYEPENGENAVTVIFMFPGGFVSGERNGNGEKAFCNKLCQNGFRAISIDYRLGLKDMHKIGLKSIGLLHRAIYMAVEDLYSATVYILAHSEELGIDTDKIVISGASAGALSVLQAEYELCNRHDIASVLPEGFNYAGVISFSGAIFSENGKIKYRETDPCPHMLLHGTSDRIVLYNGVRVFNQNFAGTNRIAKVFLKEEYPCRIMRFKDNEHEIAGSYVFLADECMKFINDYVIGNSRRQSDALLVEPAIKHSAWGSGSFRSLYVK